MERAPRQADGLHALLRAASLLFVNLAARPAGEEQLDLADWYLLRAIGTVGRPATDTRIARAIGSTAAVVAGRCEPHVLAGLLAPDDYGGVRLTAAGEAEVERLDAAVEALLDPDARLWGAISRLRALGVQLAPPKRAPDPPPGSDPLALGFLDRDTERRSPFATRRDVSRWLRERPVPWAAIDHRLARTLVSELVPALVALVRSRYPEEARARVRAAADRIGPFRTLALELSIRLAPHDVQARLLRTYLAGPPDPSEAPGRVAHWIGQWGDLDDLRRFARDRPAVRTGRHPWLARALRREVDPTRPPGPDDDAMVADFLASLDAPPSSRPAVRRSDQIHVDRVPGAVRTTLVFCVLRQPVWPTRAFLHPVLAGHDTHVVYLADPLSALYLLGIPELGPDLATTASALGALLRELGTRDLRCTGASAGGTAALRYGVALGAGAVFAVAPVTDLRPEVAEVDPRFRSDLADRLLDAAPGECGRLADRIRDEAPRMRVTAVHGAGATVDAYHSAQLAERGRVVAIADCADHLTLRTLKERGELDALLAAFYAQPCDPWDDQRGTVLVREGP